MTASDAFSEYYAELLQVSYDCVDRIVLNASAYGSNGGSKNQRLFTGFKYLEQLTE
jgi:hypothetical protein